MVTAALGLPAHFRAVAVAGGVTLLTSLSLEQRLFSGLGGFVFQRAAALLIVLGEEVQPL